MKRLVVLVGPHHEGIGGIESVIGAYKRLDLVEYRFDSLSTWNKTVPGGHSFGHTGRALLIFLRRILYWRQSDAIFYIHLSHKGSFLREGFFLVGGKKLGLKVVATVHGSSFVPTATDSRIWRTLYRLVLSQADCVSVLNLEAQETVAALGVDPLLLDNPGGIQMATPPVDAGASAPVAVFAGTVSRRKGVDILLKAWAEVERVIPQAQLKIVGPLGDADLAQAVRPYWIGPLTPRDLTQQLRESRVAVLPSRAEAMPMFLIEAMGCGRPLVVTDVGAMATQAKGCGTVVEAEDAQALSAALVRYLSDSDYATFHGNSAMQKYTENYGPEAVKKNLDKLFA
ncbi:glycosyltransferase family 4 protein [Kocuria flava]|uniref:glycosyltransferase family 4 protein n=1 Tax=Kocuria flava TaxID=446860 RepID=UPI003F1C3FEC